jgi:hypothetical protein
MRDKRRRAAVAATLAAVLGTGAFAAASVTAPEDDQEPPVWTVPAVANGTRALLAGGTLVVRGVATQAPRADGPLYEIASDGRIHRAGRLSCKRVAVSSTGRGLCFRVNSIGDGYEAVVFDASYREVRRFAVEGIPDRARLSPSGHYGAFTSFDPAGAIQYFETPEGFSTFTRIVDMRTGDPVVRLDDVEVRRGGRIVGTGENDLWGVTFRDDATYYATLATGSHHYLIRGGIGTGRAVVLRDGVECPALSPDGSRIAYKSRIAGTNSWRLHVYDLSSRADLTLSETRSIDDQPEWIGDNYVAYSDDRSIFTVAADGSGAPRRLVHGATSPDYSRP